jgi:fermentation-respiration switch protein FrsA (DUF1100 family)
MAAVRTLEVMFFSDGAALAGRFFLPAGAMLARPRPCIIATGSWLTVKEQMAQLYAERLAERDFTTFIFDFAGFGQSAGKPPQLEHPDRKIADIIAAVEFVRTMSFVDADVVGYLGICASAQYAMAAAARGAKLRALASVAGWFHDAGSVAPFYGGDDGVAMRLARANDAAVMFAAMGKMPLVPAYAEGDDRAGMFIPLEYYSSPARGAIPAWSNAMAEASWTYWLTFDGLRAASEVAIPAAFVHSEQAVFPDHIRTVAGGMRAGVKQFWTEGDQIQFYDQPKQVTFALDALTPWFVQTLGGS